MSCGKYTKEERQLKRHIQNLKQKQNNLREKWIFLDLQIGAIENKLQDITNNRITNNRKRCLTK